MYPVSSCTFQQCTLPSTTYLYHLNKFVALSYRTLSHISPLHICEAITFLIIALSKSIAQLCIHLIRPTLSHLYTGGEDLLDICPVQVCTWDVVQLCIHPVQPLSHRVHRQTVWPLHLDNNDIRYLLFPKRILKCTEQIFSKSKMERYGTVDNSLRLQLHPIQERR